MGRIRRIVYFLIGFSTISTIFLISTLLSPEPQLLINTNYANPVGKYDSFAIALKSGKEVALSRTPIQFSTFLKPIQNLILIGDGDIQVGKYKMIDVVKHLYTTNQKREIKTESTKGWIADAHKNLPGFKILYETYPHAEWFIMIDDDTFIFFDNLKRYLSNFNCDKEYYIGLPNKFRGCDGVAEFGQGPQFGQGGAGIIVSRATIKKMMLIVDKCIVKYKDCWAGDVRLGLCLRDAGILIDNSCGSKFQFQRSCASYRFFVDPPDGEVIYGDACTEPISFHHLKHNQIKEIYELEMNHRKTQTNVNMEHIAQHFLNDANTSIPGKSRFGDYFSKKSVGSAFECKLICSGIDKCVSYTFSSGYCYLRAIIPYLMNDSTGTEKSGVILSHYTCKKGWF